MRILLFGDGAWASQSLVELLESGHEVVGVAVRVNPSGPDVEQTARRYNIPILKPQRVNDAEAVASIRRLQPELGISIAYNQIFRPAAYEFLPFGLINFHAGKLPFYRGRNVVNWAIVNGEKEIGLDHSAEDVSDRVDRRLRRRAFASSMWVPRLCSRNSGGTGSWSV